MFTRLKAATFYVSDIVKAKHFYTQVLDFKIVEDQGQYVTLQIGDGTKFLLALNSQHRSFQKVGCQTISVSSDDIKRDYQKLKESGITIFDELKTYPWGEYFAFEDPDGNHIDVTEEK
ncbi:MAG: VOC family protein [Candidatus Gottesmanbacteria bacterium]